MGPVDQILDLPLVEEENKNCPHVGSMVHEIMRERAPLAITKMGVGVRHSSVARTPGSPPVGGSVHWPVCGLGKEKGEVEHKC